MPLELFVPADGTFMVEVQSRLYGQECRTRFGYERGAGAEVSGLDELVGVVIGAATQVVEAFNLLSVDLDVYNVRGYAFNSIGTFIGWKDYTSSDFTLVGAAGSIPSVAWVVKKRTGAPGRAQRGRWYFPGVPLDAVGEGTILPVVRAVWEPKAVALSETMENDAPIGNILPAIQTFNSLGNLASSKVINECVPTWVLRSQRRREIGVGM